MSEITFVKTRHSYDSYTDFFRMVELCNFPTIYVDEIDVSKHGVFIVSPMNGEYRPHINNQNQEKKPVNAHLVLWNLERPSGSAGSVGEYSQQCRYLLYGLWENGEQVNKDGVKSYGRFVDEVWVSDRRLADETRHATRFVTLGSHPELGTPGADKIYDLTHMSYENPRRQTIYNEFHNIGPNAWPPERDKILQQSKFALNIHQDQHPFQEPLRWALFAAYGLPILSETVYDSYPWVGDDTILFNPYDGMVPRMQQLLNENYSRWLELGLRARTLMCEKHRFDIMVKEAISQSVGNWR